MRMTWIGVLCFMAIGAAWGGNQAAVRQQIEASLDVSGSIAVDDKGNVTSHTIDHPDQLSPGVVDLVAKTIPTLHFKPVLQDGQPHAVVAKMNLVLVANHVDPEHVSIRIRSARFTESEPPASEQISIKSRASDRSIAHAIMIAGVGGTVYVAVRIDRNGRVIDAQAQQVNLRVVAGEKQMRRWREELAKPTLATLRKYTFAIPITGPQANDSEFSGILPVMIMLDGQAPPKYGQWKSYVPGPRQHIAWLDDKEDTSGSEAIPTGTFAQAGTALTLLTPLGDG
jgi:hypothetical protein